MKAHNKNYEDKLNALYSQQKLSIENAAKLDVYDEELDGYVAFRIRKFMNSGVNQETGVTMYYSRIEYMLDRMTFFIPDMTMERLENIMKKMQLHGFVELKDGYYYSVKASMANRPLV